MCVGVTIRDMVNDRDAKAVHEQVTRRARIGPLFSSELVQNSAGYPLSPAFRTVTMERSSFIKWIISASMVYTEKCFVDINIAPFTAANLRQRG